MIWCKGVSAAVVAFYEIPSRSWGSWWEKDSCHCQIISCDCILFAKGIWGFWVVFGAFVMLYCRSSNTRSLRIGPDSVDHLLNCEAAHVGTGPLQELIKKCTSKQAFQKVKWPKMSVSVFWSCLGSSWHLSTSKRSAIPVINSSLRKHNLAKAHTLLANSWTSSSLITVDQFLGTKNAIFAMSFSLFRVSSRCPVAAKYKALVRQPESRSGIFQVNVSSHNWTTQKVGCTCQPLQLV